MTAQANLAVSPQSLPSPSHPIILLYNCPGFTEPKNRHLSWVFGFSVWRLLHFFKIMNKYIHYGFLLWIYLLPVYFSILKYWTFKGSLNFSTLWQLTLPLLTSYVMSKKDFQTIWASASSTRRQKWEFMEYCLSQPCNGSVFIAWHLF